MTELARHCRGDARTSCSTWMNQASTSTCDRSRSWCSTKPTVCSRSRVFPRHQEDCGPAPRRTADHAVLGYHACRHSSELANSILRNPVNIQVVPVSTTAELIEQSVYYVAGRPQQARLVAAHSQDDGTDLAAGLHHGRKPHGRRRHEAIATGRRMDGGHPRRQNRRRIVNEALEGFRAGKVPVLVATDIAEKRGIDVDRYLARLHHYDVLNVVEIECAPDENARGVPERRGIAMSFCDHEERSDFRAIERLIRRTIEVKNDHPEYPRSNEALRSTSDQGMEAIGRRRESAAPASPGSAATGRRYQGSSQQGRSSYRPAGSGAGNSVLMKQSRRRFSPCSRRRGRGRPAGSSTR